MLHFIVFVVLVFVVLGAIIFIKNFESQVAVEEVFPYRAKRFFFTKSEQQFFRILNESLDSQRFTIFTKVRLADFVEVKTSKEEYQKWWNKIRSKHVDFLVWDTQNSKIVLAVEVDGKSHESEKMIASDAFKDKMYTTIGISLHRIKVGSDFKIEVEKLIKLLSLV
jgi:very-short-patch-repair endonuclease